MLRRRLHGLGFMFSLQPRTYPRASPRSPRLLHERRLTPPIACHHGVKAQIRDTAGFPLFHSCCSRPPPPSPPWMEIVRPAAAVGCSHQRIYVDWFTLADPDGDGRVTGADATKFFAMSGLSRADLKQVWAIADSRRQGFLGFGEFASAM